MKILIKVIAVMIILAGQVYAQVTQEWVQRFTSDSARDETINEMAVDAQGNVYVTGSQKGPNLSQLQAVTVKYNSQGVQQWIQNFVSPNNNGAFGRAIHVDAGGNVYVTGENAIVSGGSNEMLVIKYSPAGAQLWFYRYQYTGSFYCGGFDIITDALGNVYVTGETGNGANDLVLVKFSPSGALTGQTIWNYQSEGGRKIALNGAGKIIVSGYCNINQADSTRFVVLTYEQNLDFVWGTRCGSKGSGNPSQSVNGMAVDINSNIIIIGQNDNDYATIKINPDGSIQWNKFLNYNSDVPRGIVTDNQGNIYVTGETGHPGFYTTAAITTVKYNPDGDLLWLRRYNGESDNDGHAGYSIAIDNSSNIYIAGNKLNTTDIATIKYNTNGSLQWVKTYNGPSNNTDRGVSVGADAYGNVYTAGNSLHFPTGYDIAILKYSPVSVFAAEFKKNSLSKAVNDLQSTYDTISVDYSAPVNYFVHDVNLKIDSLIHPNDSDLEFYLIHNGVTDTVIYRAGGTGDNFLGTVLNDSAVNNISGGSAPFTGSFKPASLLSQFNNSGINGTWILKIYDRASGNTGLLKAWSLNFVIGLNPTGIHHVSEELPESFSLSQNYPNPFNPVTNFRFQIQKPGFVKLTIFDMVGREVETLVNENLTEGSYSVDWNASGLASGVYFYRIEAGSFLNVKKMALVK